MMTPSGMNLAVYAELQAPGVRNPNFQGRGQYNGRSQGGQALTWQQQQDYQYRHQDPNFFTHNRGGHWNYGGNGQQFRFEDSAPHFQNRYPSNSGVGRGSHGYHDRGATYYDKRLGNNYNNNTNRGRGNYRKQGGPSHSFGRSSEYQQASRSDNQSRGYHSDTRDRGNDRSQDRTAGKNDSHPMSPQASPVKESQRDFSSDDRDRDNQWNEGMAAGKDDRYHVPQESTGSDDRYHVPQESTGSDDRYHVPQESTGSDDRYHVPQESTANETERSFHTGASDRDNEGNEDWAPEKDDKHHVSPLASTSKETERSKDSLQNSDGGTSKDKKKNKNPDSQRGNRLWMGTPLDELKRAPKCFNESQKEQTIQALMSAKDHYFAVTKGTTPHGNIFESKNEAKSYGHTSVDYSSEDYVSMPYSACNWNREIGYHSNWEQIKHVLSSLEIGNVHALEAVIKSYNSPNWKFDVLHHFFEKIGTDASWKFFSETLPKMQKLALKLPVLFPKPLPILKQRTNKKITLSQEQVACLLAHAFFCTFPKRLSRPKGGQTSNNNRPRVSPLPDINFNSLYSQPMSNRKIEKLKCLINYFQRVTEKMPEGSVTYARQCLSVNNDFWFKMEKRLTNLYVSTEGTIEDVGVGMLQVDFANKFVGGGVLTNGLVQEEINFVLCPEMILSRLFTEMLTHTEVLIMKGCERFSNYKGYSDSFMYNESYQDQTKSDTLGRRYTEVVAMDALVFRDAYESQFENNNVIRELSKAYCAFKRNEAHTDLPAICTGNWGCGAFGGDKQLKALIQMMAASAADRDVCYLTFDDDDLCNTFGQIHEILKEKNLPIRDILPMILDYGKKLYRYPPTQETLFQYIAGKLERILECRVIKEKRNKQNSDTNENRNEPNSEITEVRNFKSSKNSQSSDGGLHEKKSRQSPDVHEKKSKQSPDVHEKKSKQGPDVNVNRNRNDSHRENAANTSKSSKKKSKKKKK